MITTLLLRHDFGIIEIDKMKFKKPGFLTQLKTVIHKMYRLFNRYIVNCKNSLSLIIRTITRSNRCKRPIPSQTNNGESRS